RRVQSCSNRCGLLVRMGGRAVSENALESRLSQISTAWTTLFRAHQGTPDEGQQARRRLLELYGVPVYRYLRAAVRDPDAAGALHRGVRPGPPRGHPPPARPPRGRFRDSLKTTLYHPVIDHHRRQGRRPAPLPAEDPGVAAAEAGPASDAEFLV